MRQFTYRDAKSHKFWNIELKGTSFTVTYGRLGAKGQTQTKTFPTEEKARKEHDKLVKEKLGKGYVEVGAKPVAAAGGGMRAALEAALVADPDDLANHMAYADWLAEQGDARGEFIQVQLALEDAGKSPAERKTLLKREQELLKKHQHEWLGDLATPLLDPPPAPHEWRQLKSEFRFARGWLDYLHVDNFTVALTRALARAPQARLLRHLVLTEAAYEERGEYEPGDDIPADVEYEPQLYPLLRSRHLNNVRVFQLGVQVDTDEHYNCRTAGDAAVAVIKLMPKLEELYLLAHNVDSGELFGLRTLTNLRVLQMYHNVSYPLPKLAKNPAFANLTQLLCHPHNMEGDEPYIRLADLRAVVRSTVLTKLAHLQLRMTDVGDKGCDEVVQSGALGRLKLLDLRGGTITDAGAATLAGCRDLRNLERLNLDRNCLTDAGIKALKATKVPFTARNQWRPSGDEYDDQEYLFEGDLE
jgi:uncharacterized protein (TIGR02996 family)